MVCNYCQCLTTAQQLYDYVVVMMPWWKPNSLGEEKAWQVTAYLIKLRGNFPEGITRDETNASAVPVHQNVTAPQDQLPAIYFFLGTLFLGMIGFIARDFLTRREHASPADRPAGPGTRPGFVPHLHPPTIPALQARWRYKLGAGGAAVFLCFVLVVTGLLEMFYYIPTTEKAAISVETMVKSNSTSRRLAWGGAALLILLSGWQDYDLVFHKYYQQYRTSAWNSSEMGQAVRKFIGLSGSPVSVWVVGYPHWVDTRLVALNAGFPGRDFQIFPEQLESTLSDKGLKMFILNPQDAISMKKLAQLYPAGWFQEVQSEVESRISHYSWYRRIGRPGRNPQFSKRHILPPV